MRKEELNIIRKVAYFNACTFIIWNITPFMVTLLSYATYVLMEGNVLDANVAFVSLTLFNILRMPLILIPMSIAIATQCWVAITRINNFLNGEELDQTSITHHKDGKTKLV